MWKNMAATAGSGKYHTGGYSRIGVYRVKPNLVFCNMELFGPVGPAGISISYLDSSAWLNLILTELLLLNT